MGNFLYERKSLHKEIKKWREVSWHSFLSKGIELKAKGDWKNFSRWIHSLNLSERKETSDTLEAGRIITEPTTGRRRIAAGKGC